MKLSEPPVLKLVLVSGVSGAGKTTVLHALEDLDFYCADNLPLPLLPKFVELLAMRQPLASGALVIDARNGNFLNGGAAALAAVRAAGHEVEVVFLDAPDDVLIRRFSETRRRHPLSGTDIRAGLRDERTRLAELRAEATSVIDTGGLTVHALRAITLRRYGDHAKVLALSFMSFGFKFGIPAEADIVLDVRFLPNPYFVAELSAKTGRDPGVRDFVLQSEGAGEYLDKAEELLALSIKGFQREGKAYATVAIGCTGGRHRSVAVTLELGRRFAQLGSVSVRHRDLPEV